jgi:hypothetical protein
MASRSMTGRTKTFGVSEKCVRLKLFPDSTGTATFTSQGGVASVARSAAGKFLITFQDAYLSLVDYQVAYSTSADNVDLYAQLGAVSNLGTSTAATAVVKLKTGATNTDAAAAAADNFISCCFVFEDSSA